LSLPHDAAETQVTSPVVLDGVSRHFGRFAALRGVTAEFAAGRIYVIVGENGAGKSTLLRLIAGLLAPTRGRVRLLGAENPRAAAARTGLMEHASLLYDELDARENLRYFAALYGMSGAPAEDACRRALRTVGLDPELKRRVGQYSQGMRQRLSLARCLLPEPELLLLDEPFSNVDAASAAEMVRVLGERRDAGRTVLVVTHQPALLAPVADEFVTMSGGRIVRRAARLEDVAAPAGYGIAWAAPAPVAAERMTG
jgi:ABC-type multidrug transport system ATPase subunit